MTLRVRQLFLPLLVAAGAYALVPPADEQTKPLPGEKPDATRVATGARKYVIKVAPKYFYMPGNIPMGVGNPLQGLRLVEERFEALHPDTNIEYVGVPGAREWLVTQAAAGLAPDIVDVNVEEVWGDTHKGWYVPLDEFLARPSPFSKPGEPGSARWSDVMKYPAISESVIAPDGKTYCIVYDMVETGIFYNKDIFKKLGLAPPATWEEFLVLQQKLRKGGYIPMLSAITNVADWATDLFFDQLYASILPGIDVEPEEERLKAFRDGYLDWDEISFLQRKGFFTKDDPRYVEMWRLIKEWRSYMSPDIGDKSTDFIKIFLTQRGAMVWTGSWEVHRFRNDPTMDFEWDIFYLPPVTPDTSKFADGHPQVVIGGPGTQFVVTNSAIKDTGTSATSERLKRCISFLQFLTTPESTKAVVNEVAVFLPNLKGVEPRPELSRFDEFLKRRSSITKWQFTFDMKFNEVMLRMLELYLNDGISEEEYLDWMDRNLDGAIKTMVRRQKPDFAPLEKRWAELAPMRADMPGLPDAAR